MYNGHMKRYIENQITEDLKKKMVFITGPRQVGKTYLSKQIRTLYDKSVYLNYDSVDDAKIIRSREWPLENQFIILDELHKMKGWKNYLKGVFDTRPEHQSFLVTGSARLDTFRKTGDSLSGRYFAYRLNPLSVKELAGSMKPFDALNALNRLGGFPEPFLSGSEDFAGRWRAQYYTDLVRDDILEFSRIDEIRSMKLLLELLRRGVASPISYANLAGDLQISPVTVKKYLEILEALFIIIIVKPFHRNIARSILKEPKVYFYDSGYVDGDEGVKLENTFAVSLLKHIQYLQDIKGAELSLNYLKTKDGREIDFVITEKGEVKTFIEVKLSDQNISKDLRYFKDKYQKAQAVQAVHNLRQARESEGIQVAHAGEVLEGLEA